MKKLNLSCILLLSCMFSLAQSKVPIFNVSILDGHKIKTTIENNAHGKVTGSAGVDRSFADNGPIKIEKLIWETNIDKVSVNWSVSKKLKRIIFNVTGPIGMEKYDSDNSFESSEGSENWVKKSTEVLNKSSVKAINDDLSVNEKAVAISKTDAVWNSNLPVYEGSMYWNGLLISVPSSFVIADKASWSEMITLNDREVQTKFTIVKSEPSLITIDLISKEKFKNVGDDNLSLVGGAPRGMSLGLKKREKTFVGTISVDRKSLMILTGTFKIEVLSDLSINGGSSEQKSYSTTTITNTIEK